MHLRDGCAREFDRLDGSLEVSKKEMQAAAKTVAPSVRTAIRVAARNIRAVAKKQVPRGWRVTVATGVTVEQRVIPLDRVGCYVPGGRYPLPSTLLMTAIPAATAGVKDVVVACPKPDAVVMAAALEAGVSRLFRIGGAQAIAALAYGTDSIPRVDKIVGPGNRYVAAGRDPTDVTVAVYVRTSLGASEAECMLALRTAAGEYASYPAYARQFALMGLEDEAAQAAAAWAAFPKAASGFNCKSRRARSALKAAPSAVWPSR